MFSQRTASRSGAVGAAKRVDRKLQFVRFLFACGVLSAAASGVLADILIPKDSSWEYLNPVGAANNPENVDPDFNSTFMTPANYNGPAFNAPSPALLGFGVMDNNETFKTTIDGGTSGDRYTVYVRKEFTTTATATSLNVSILADDGGIMYIDGAEVGRINYTGGTESYLSFTPNGTGGNEAGYTTVPLTLASLPAGNHVFAMSVHQANATSSDLGFNLTLNGSLPPPPQFGSVIPNPQTKFSEPAIGAKIYTRGTNPPGTELGFSSIGSGQGVTDYSGDKQFKVNNGSINFKTELIDLRTVGAATAKIDLRTYSTTGGGGFETFDRLNAYVETSLDGLTFTKTDFFNQTGDSVPGTIGLLDALESGVGGANGPFTHFTLNIPSEVAALRFGVIAQNDNATEFMLFDNIALTTGAAQYPGDCDGNGTVNFDDLNTLLTNYGLPGDFSKGDFDGNGTVEFADLNTLLTNYGTSAPQVSVLAPVPEPSSILLVSIGLGGVMLMLRRNRG